MSASEFVSTFSIPTYLFIFLNLIIGTIYITSRLAKPHPPRLAAPLGLAASSLVDRVRSIDLPFFKFDRLPEPLARAPSLLGRLRSINFYQKKFEHRDPEPEQLHPAEAVYNSAVSHEQSLLSRAPLLLDKLKSINIYHQKSDLQADTEPVNTLNRAPSLLKLVKSIKLPSFYNPGEANLDTESDNEDVNGAEDHAHGLVRRIRSESEAMGEQGQKPRMRKMASEKSAASAAAEDNVEVEEIDEDNVEVEGIDAMADDFIQRFRQQLRLDSLIRCKDLLTGGTLNRAPSLLKLVKSIKLPSFYNPGEANLDTESDNEDVNGAEDHAHGLVRRIRSESEGMGNQGPKPRMRKMASEKSAASAAAEDNVEVEEIDAMADDFIQRFRQQLRLDSLIRCKDLLTGGTLNRAPSLLKLVKSIKLPPFYNPGEANLDTESDNEDVNGAEDHVHGLVRRIRSESEGMGEQGPKPRMRKMASNKSAAAAAAAAEDNVEVEEIDEDNVEVGEINAMADDFIQKFRRQLRLDSLIRYKDLLTGGEVGAAR